MKMLRVITIGMVFLITTLPSTLSGGQLSQQAPPPPGRMPPLDMGDPNPRLEEQQQKARSTERQKKLVADTDKLLALATELKTDVDKTNKDILSMDVIKKADEIEKLAHSVKERMKG
jgi:type VI protein secretion system component VasF